jgi:MFS family permease
VIDAYALTLAALQLTAGSLADRFGRRACSRSASSSSRSARCCAAGAGSTFLSLARAFQGIGGAIMFATGLAALATPSTGRDRGVAFGVFGAVTGVAVAVGPVIGGALTSGLSWRWIFSSTSRSAIVALLDHAARRSTSRATRTRAGRLPRPRHVQRRPRALVYGLIRSNEDGWGSGTSSAR